MLFLESPVAPALRKLRQDAYHAFQPSLGPISKKQDWAWEWERCARCPLCACKKLHSTAACPVNIHKD